MEAELNSRRRVLFPCVSFGLCAHMQDGTVEEEEWAQELTTMLYLL